MPQPKPKELRDDVIRVALNRDENTATAQITKDFGVHESTIAKWLRQVDIDAETLDQSSHCALQLSASPDGSEESAPS